MKAKFTIAALVLALAGAGTAFACGGPGGPDMAQKHEKMLEQLDQKLDLTDEQAARVKAVFDAAQQKHQAVHDETQKALGGILSPEQMQKFEQLHQERMEKMREHHKGKRGDGPADAAP